MFPNNTASLACQWIPQLLLLILHIQFLQSMLQHLVLEMSHITKGSDTSPTTRFILIPPCFCPLATEVVRRFENGHKMGPLKMMFYSLRLWQHSFSVYRAKLRPVRWNEVWYSSVHLQITLLWMPLLSVVCGWSFTLCRVTLPSCCISSHLSFFTSVAFGTSWRLWLETYRTGVKELHVESESEIYTRLHTLPVSVYIALYRKVITSLYNQRFTRHKTTDKF